MSDNDFIFTLKIPAVGMVVRSNCLGFRVSVSPIPVVSELVTRG